MADNTENIYIKMNIDTKSFDGSMTGIKREMATLRGLVGNSLLSQQDSKSLQGRLGQLKNDLDDVKIAANNIDVGDVFGNTARFAGVAANAVAGVTGAMSLLGIESKKAGEVEKQILQFMAIGNALQSVADAKRLGSLAEIYGQRLKDLILGKQVLAQEIEIASVKSTTGGVDGVSGNVEVTDTSNIAKANAAANVSQAASMSSVTTAIEGQSVAIATMTTEEAQLNALISQQNLLLGKNRVMLADTEQEIGYLEGNLHKTTNEQNRLNELENRAIDLTDKKNELLGKKVKYENDLADVLENSTKTVSEQSTAEELNTVAKNSNSIATVKAAFAQGGFIAGSKAAAKATWEWTAALLMNPITWFVVALAAAAAGIYLLVRALTAESRAQKAGAEATKEHAKYLKELSDQANSTQNSIDALTDRILVNAGKMTESDAKRKENGRQFNDDMIKLSEELVKEQERINKEYDDNKDIGTRKRDDLLKSAQDQFNKNALKLTEEFNTKQSVITSDAEKLANDKAIEAAKTSAAKLRAEREKEFDALVKEVQDETARLIALQDAQNAEVLSAEVRSIEIRRNQYKKYLADNIITQNEYNRQSRQLDLELLINQRDELQKQYDKFIGLESDKIKLKTLLNNKVLEIDTKITDNYVANKSEEAASLIEFNNLFKDVEDEQSKIRLDNIEKAKQADASALDRRKQVFGGLFTDFDKLNPEEKLAAFGEVAVATTQIAADSINAIISVTTAKNAQLFEEQMQTISDSYDVNIKQIDDAMKYGNLTQQEYDKRKEVLDKKRASEENKLKKEQAEKNKKTAIFQAIISTAQAVVSSLAQPPGVPLTIPFGILAGVLGAIQIAAIAATPVPQYALGGRVNGLPHSQGGVPINAEGGEFIIKKSVVQLPGMGSFLTKVNSGQVQPYQSSGIDMDQINTIIKKTIEGVVSIPIYNVESDSTRIQRKVANIETKSSW